MTLLLSGAGRTPPSTARGGALLEALVGILIFSLGVLGLVGLQARSLGYMSDAQYRGEAAYLANSYIARMWAANPARLTTDFQTVGQREYDVFASAVATLPGAASIAGNPTVTITQAPAGGTADACAAAGFPAGCNVSLPANSSVVTIGIQWIPPAVDTSSPDLRDTGGNRVPHNYTVSAVISSN